ncbi:MAG: SCO family protein [Gammaproteobacteria bacterium]
MKTKKINQTLLIGICLFLSIAGVHGVESRKNMMSIKNEFVQNKQNSKRGEQSYFTDLPLMTHNGEQKKFYTDLLKDKVVLIHFIFTDCKDACPMTTVQLKNTQKFLGDRLGQDIYFLSITVDPEVDTPERLKDYSRRLNADKGWLFLTGKKQDVDTVSSKLGQLSPVPEGHLPLFLLGNVNTGHWLKMQPFSAPAKIAEQLLALAQE